MIPFVLSRLARAVFVLVGVMLITFLLMHAVPGNPWSNYSTLARMQVGTTVDQAIQRQISHHFGLDLPLWRQFTRYLIGDFELDGRFICGSICGNLGPSTRQRGRMVQAILFDPPDQKPIWNSRFGFSTRMVFLGAFIAVGLGVPLGLWSAARPKSMGSRVISLGLAALISIPNFVLGLLAILVLASWLKVIKVLPDWDNPMHWIVPAIVLAAMPMASIARLTHATLLNILGEDFVRAARAKGLTPARVMWVHVLRNAIAPVITFLGPTVIEMFTGLLIVERLYAFPGFGREYWEAVINLDYPMIMGLTFIYAIGILFANMAIEVAAAILDPRMRLARQQGAP